MKLIKKGIRILNSNLRLEVSGFSLTEILVVLIIIGILVMMALPRLMPLITKAKSVEAKLQLTHLHTLEKTYFYTFSKYTVNIEEIGFEQEKLVDQGGTANYKIEIIAAGQDFFTAQAVSIVDFDSDGTFNVWEINQDKQLVEKVTD